jgi:hypothetical protein
MSEVFAAVQGFFAKLDGLDEAGLFFQIATYGFLHKSVCIATLVSGELRKPVFLFGREMHFHTLQFSSDLRQLPF